MGVVFHCGFSSYLFMSVLTVGVMSDYRHIDIWWLYLLLCPQFITMTTVLTNGVQIDFWYPVWPRNMVSKPGVITTPC